MADSGGISGDLEQRRCVGVCEKYTELLVPEQPDRGEVQVMDWGLAKVLTSRDREGAEDDPDFDPQATTGTAIHSLRDDDDAATQVGTFLGTLAFMPPEQALGAIGKVNQRSDVFGLSAILAVVLTGQPPFPTGSRESLRVQAAQGKLDDCFARLDTCGAEPDLVALCKRCLHPDPAGRPADAGEVAAAVAGLRQAADERARRAETGSSDRTAKVWDAGKGTEVLALKGHTSIVSSVAFSPDGQRLFAWDAQGNLLAWSIPDGKPIEPRDPPQKPRPGPAFSPDGHLVAEANGLVVTVTDVFKPAPKSNPFPDAAERKRYHSEQAALAEKEKQHFALAFHLGRLLLDDPNNADLKKRRDDALKRHADTAARDGNRNKN